MSRKLKEMAWACVAAAVIALALADANHAKAEGSVSPQRQLRWKCDSGYLFPYLDPFTACNPNYFYPHTAHWNATCPDGRGASATDYSDLYVSRTEPGVVEFGIASTTSFAGPGNCVGGSASNAPAYRATAQTTTECPVHSTPNNGTCDCDIGYKAITRDRAQLCAKLVINDLTKSSPQSCREGFGNPILPLRGIKREALAVTSGIGGIDLSLHYDSSFHAPRSDYSAIPLKPAAPLGLPPMGSVWSHSFHGFLLVSPDLRWAQAAHGDGSESNLQGPGDGTFVGTASTEVTVAPDPSGGYRLYRPALGRMEVYAADGRLMTIAYADGRQVSLAYAGPGGQLSSATDSFGRTLQFGYGSVAVGARVTENRLVRITLPDRRIVNLQYEAGNLRYVSGPDYYSYYLYYEDTRSPWALTGVRGLDGIRRSSFGYDAEGRATSTERAGAVGRYSASYTSPPRIEVSDVDTGSVVLRTLRWRPPAGLQLTLPDGATATLDATPVNGVPRLTGQSQPAGAGCAASSSAVGLDANGNPDVEDDFNGNRVCRVFDQNRNLPTVVVEGLRAPQACASLTATSAVLPAGTRKTSTQWHPDWALPVIVSTPGQRASYVYNGQPDPFDGGRPARCAPAEATLPDGKPIAVLCRQVAQATTDADGSLGLAAPLDVAVAPRAMRWTYNARGQMLTQTDSLGNTTSYSYYADTAFTGVDPTAEGHTVGDLHRITTPPTPSQPQGLVTTFETYNKTGRLLRTTDPNGVATVDTHDPRQRLLSTTVGGQTTRYEYWLSGLLKQVTQPDTSWVYYEYDPAYRLKKVADSQGNSVTYTLDNFGNRTAEDVRDPGNVLRRTLSRGIDGLGRIQQVTGREQAP